jgi:hypothetical protein
MSTCRIGKPSCYLCGPCDNEARVSPGSTQSQHKASPCPPLLSLSGTPGWFGEDSPIEEPTLAALEPLGAWLLRAGVCDPGWCTGCQ